MTEEREISFAAFTFNLNLNGKRPSNILTKGNEDFSLH
jgi:hypothetical protein